MLKELQKKTVKQLNKIIKTIQEQNEKFNKEIENKKEPTRTFGAEKYNDWIEEFDRASKGLNHEKESHWLENRLFEII